LAHCTNMIDGYMTTNFALSLSFDGIRLLQRVADGWHLVGEVGLDADDLGAELADLREKALSLDPSGLRTKLLIPDEQIKHITLETAQTDLNDVMSALEGATPYALKDLVVDFDRNGGRTFIAAVARETLEEAEAFARKYQFAPVSFAAIAEPMTFKTEVFFGPTKMASSIVGGPIVRDDAPVKVTGTVAFPDPEPEDDVDAALFTVRPRMATPESVAEPDETDTVGAADPSKADEAPKPETAPDAKAEPAQATKTPMGDKPPLAVPTGNVIGPAIGAADKSTIAPPTINPITVKKPAAAAAPAVTGEPENAAPKPAPLAAIRADDMAAKGGFSSRRAGPEVAPKPQEPTPAAKSNTEAIASKQAQTKRGKPRFLGLILTAILLIAMALVALWASTLSEEQVSAWFGNSNGSVIEAAAAAPPETDAPATQAVAAAPQAEDATVTAASETQQATDEVPLPQVRDTDTPHVLSPAEADRLYAATGVWQRAPRLPLEPRTEELTAPIPAALLTSARVAQPDLPEIAGMSPDLSLLPPVNPPAPGTEYVRDADGFVLATPEGALTPTGAVVFAGRPTITPPVRPAAAAEISPPEATNGVVVISGRPSKVPPLRPANAALPEAATGTDTTAGGVDIAGLRPSVRPEELAPADEAAVIAADPALAGFRPQVRPAGLAPAVAVAEPDPVAEAPAAPDITAVVAAIADAAPPSPFVSPTARAVTASRHPDPRPNNFARVVARATDLANQQAARAATAAAPAPAPSAAPTTNVSNAAAQPSGAVPGGVAQAATLEGAIRLRDINLIGVYGQPNNRRALVRLGNGRYVKVEIGSSLDGGQVTAIGDNALNYVKRGKTYALQLPAG